MSGALAQIAQAKQALAQARTLDDVLNIRDKAEAVRVYAKASAEGLEAQNYAAEIKLLAERKAGELLAAMEMNKGGRPSSTGDMMSLVTLEDLGVDKKQSSRWQKEAAVPDEDFAALVQECNDNGQELTQAALLKRANGPHVSHNSGNNEWYTPAEYIEAARRVLGNIDLDPASCDVANQTVQAGRFYTTDDDGLTQDWSGRIWMNPPYGQPVVSHFCSKLVDEFHNGDVTEAISLTNNATDTQWFRTLAGSASARCDIAGRVRFIGADGNPGQSPLQGQCLLYFGDRTAEFIAVFASLGDCWKPAREPPDEAD